MSYNDNSPDCRQWSNRHLFWELRRVANFERFGPDTFVPEKTIDRTGDAFREATALYRKTWLDPLIDELARRLNVEP
jgi:hypothetical protein